MKAMKVLMALLLLGAAGYGGVIGWRSGPLKLRTVEVLGNQRVSAPEIVGASGLTRGSHLLELSVRRIEKRMTSVPWVKRARAERILPSKVRITVVERKAVLIAVLGSRSYLVDDEGVVLEEVVQDDPAQVDSAGARDLMIVTSLPLESIEPGEKIDLAQFDDVLTISRQLPSDLRARVVEVRAASIDRIALLLDDSVLVIYGAAEEIEDKNHAIVSIIEKSKAQGRPLRSIDVRVPTRPAVRVS